MSWFTSAIGGLFGLFSLLLAPSRRCGPTSSPSGTFGPRRDRSGPGWTFARSRRYRSLSPGNLYYHFAGKQQIIRALHDRYAAAHEELWDPGRGGQAGLARLRANLARGMELAWQYRFFERELVALLRADPQLRASYREVYQRRLAQWVRFGEQLAAGGIISPPRPPATIAGLATAIWLIGASWLPFLEITGDPHDPEQVARGGDLVLAVLGPYLAGPQAGNEEEP